MTLDTKELRGLRLLRARQIAADVMIAKRVRMRNAGATFTNTDDEVRANYVDGNWDNEPSVQAALAAMQDPTPSYDTLKERVAALEAGLRTLADAGTGYKDSCWQSYSDGYAAARIEFGEMARALLHADGGEG